MSGLTVREVAIVVILIAFVAAILLLPSWTGTAACQEQEKTSQEEVQRLLTNLDDPGWRTREEATTKLLELWREDAVIEQVRQRLAWAEKEGHAEVALRCSLILEKMTIPNILGERLWKALGPGRALALMQPNEADVLQAFEEWAWIADSYSADEVPGMSQFFEWVLEHLTTESAQQRFLQTVTYCARGVEIWGKPLADACAPFCDAESSRVRSSAIRAIGRVKAKEHAALIVEHLRDESIRVRCAAVSALADVGSGEHAGEIAELLEDDAPIVRVTTVRVLGELQAAKFADGVVAKLADGDVDVRIEAVTALARLGGARYAQNIAALLCDRDGLVRSQAIRALRELGAREHLGEIAKLVTDPAPKVRCDAIRTLVRLSAGEYVGDIATGLKDEKPHVRILAAEALRKFDATDWKEEIRKLLHDEDESVRIQTEAILKDWGEPVRKSGD